MSRLVKIERDQLGTRGGKGDLYVPVKHFQRILEIVADEYDVSADEMLDHSEHKRTPLVYAACCVATYALRQLTGASMPKIAQLTGYAHHSSSMHNYDEVEKKRKRSEDYRAALDELITRIHEQLGETP